MVEPDPRPTKRERTRARLTQSALDLFERQGFEETTVAQIAAAAGVTEMTFYRYFASKSRVVLDDPYDVEIVAALVRQPPTLAPLARVIAGLRAAWQTLPAPDAEVTRRRVRIVANCPALWGESPSNNAETERLIVGQLVDDGADRLTARAATAACLAAITASLLEWSQRDDLTMSEAFESALRVLERDDD